MPRPPAPMAARPVGHACGRNEVCAKGLLEACIRFARTRLERGVVRLWANSHTSHNKHMRPSKRMLSSKPWLETWRVRGRAQFDS